MNTNAKAKNAGIFFLIFFSMISSLMAQSQICSYRWNSSTGCQTPVDCLDSASMQGRTIVVPSNITRIAPDGLKLCLADKDINAPADIIYVVDMSGSMSPASTASTPPGDPYFKRAEAIRAGFDFQVDSVPGSYVGYLGFASNIVRRNVSPYNQTYSYYPGPVTGQRLKGIHFLSPRNTNIQLSRDSLDTIAAWLNYDQHIYMNSGTTTGGGGGTDYHLALSQAAAWFGNPAYSPHPDNRAIIFISDGEPNPNDNAWNPDINTLKQQGVHIFGIFLGQNGAMGQTLQDISNATGGYTVSVPPTNTDTLKTVVKNLVKQITIYNFDTLTVTANGITANSRSALKRTNPPSSFNGYEMSLDKVLPLYPGNNIVTVNSMFSSNNGDKPVNYSFTIKVDPARAPEPTCYFCYNRSVLQILNSGTNASLDTILPSTTSFKVRLSYYGSDSSTLNNLDMTIKTNKGDSERVILQKVAIQGGAAIFERTVTFAIPPVTTPATKNNGTAEALSIDLLRARWVHPWDTTDFAIDSAIVNSGPDSLRVYSVVGSPASLTPLRIRPLVDTVVAGTPKNLWAKVFNTGNWLAEYETVASLSGKFTWSIVRSGGGSSAGIAQLSPLAGNHVVLTAQRAWDSVDVTVTLNTGVRTLTNVMRFYIKPGSARHVFIESDSIAPKNSPNPIDTLWIADNETSRSVYAILRDSIGNFVSYSTQASWASLNVSVVTAASGNTAIGQGLITRNPSSTGGTTSFSVTSLDFGTMNDTAAVVVLQYHYTRLRIVNSAGNQITTTQTISTNDSATLRVQGLRSDDGTTWEYVDATWKNTPALSILPNAPERANTWTFSPVAPGSGKIWVTMGNDAVTIPDTIDVSFTRGEPLSADFTIITLSNQQRAGDTILAVISIRNQDGLVPGSYCYPQNSGVKGIFSDNLISPATKPPAVVVATEDTATINNSSAVIKDSTRICFNGGLDTVRIVLFNAPYKGDSTHTLTVTLGNLTASAPPISLLPGALDSLDIQNVKRQSITSITLRDSFTVLYAIGFDRFGNRMDTDSSGAVDWTTTGTLHPVSNGQNIANIYYNTTNTTDNETGLIIASISERSIADTVACDLLGPRAGLLHAYTKDANGNGYLDGIELHFTKAINMPCNTSVSLFHALGTFTVDSIGGCGGERDSIFMVYLRDEHQSTGPGPLQTGWKPLITAIGIEDAAPILQYATEDLAGPVISSVTKEIKTTDNRFADVVTVIFSEPVQGADGSSILQGTPPRLLFDVWILDNNGTYQLSDSILAGIEVLNTPYDTVVTFKMSNGRDLNSNYYFSLRTDPASTSNDLVVDKIGIGNRPNANNRKVQVLVNGRPPDRMKVGPNPAHPYSGYVPPGQLLLKNDPNAPAIARENGGTTFSFNFVLPPPSFQTEIKAELRIFDVVGNVVHSASTNNLLQGYPGVGSLPTQVAGMAIYWNGYNQKGMAVAPGVYQAVLYLSYRESLTNTQAKRLIATVGIKR